MKNKIHYCWFGGNPLTKLSKKCIKSWQIYLPDFEIIEWNETNCDINECKFVSEAYKAKKWAFVADYFRTKALKEYGGIYFDTDMEVTKDISELLKDNTFLGVEDSGNVAVGVWWEKNKEALLPTNLLEYYQNLDGFNPDKVYDYSIPSLITKVIKNYGTIKNSNEIQKIKDIVIYPRDYFYPLSYDRQNDIFTDNTCMIHYYDATWVPKWEQKEIKVIRKYGREKAKAILERNQNIKKIIKKTIKVILFPAVLTRRYIHEYNYRKEQKTKFINSIKEIENNKPIVICNDNWLGTTYATQELFENTVSIREINTKKDMTFYANELLKKNPNLIVFSAFAKSWKQLIETIKETNPNIDIKVLWHGSNAANVEPYDYDVFKTIFNLLNTGKIKSIGFVKKSMYDQYKKLGYNVEFVKNRVSIDNKIEKQEKNSDVVKIGLYASGDRWLKNFYNQLSGAALIENAVIDIIPLSTKTVEFAKILKTNVTGTIENVSREEMVERLSKNDINIYVTFVDCAPITPLESLEVGVPCITGNNHHYWDNAELYDYLVVDKADNSIEIAKKIEYCLKNKDKILKLYADWKKENDKESIKSVNKFLNK